MVMSFFSSVIISYARKYSQNEKILCSLKWLSSMNALKFLSVSWTAEIYTQEIYVHSLNSSLSQNF